MEMDTSIKINKAQAAILEAIMHPIIVITPEIDDENILLYFTLQAVLQDLTDRLERIKWNGTKAKKIQLSKQSFFALMYAVNVYETDDAWINANLIDIADKMNRQYNNTITTAMYIEGARSQ